MDGGSIPPGSTNSVREDAVRLGPEQRQHDRRARRKRRRLLFLGIFLVAGIALIAGLIRLTELSEMQSQCESMAGVYFYSEGAGKCLSKDAVVHSSKAANR
jgi:hypothetical protein